MALGGSDSTQKIYALKKQENQEILQNASLIVIETNINEYHSFSVIQHSFTFKTVGRNFELLCKELSNLQTRILFLILPVYIKDENLKKALDTIINLNRIKIKEYGFNFIDMQRYYEDKNLNEFYATTDPYHQLRSLMCELGKNIINHLKFYKESPIKKPFKIPEILVKTPPQMFNLKENLEYQEFKNSAFDEIIYKLDNQTKLQFKEEFKDYCLLALALWNNFEAKGWSMFSSFVLQNQNTKIVKAIRATDFICHTLSERFILDNQSFMCLNTLNESITEGSLRVPKNTTNLIYNLKHCGLVYFVLAKKDELFDKQEFEIFESLKQWGLKVDNFKDFQNLDETQIVEFLSNLNIELPKDYDFSYLIPPVEVYKEIIEEYCAGMDPVKLNSLQKFGTATQRIHNRLSYKLGQIIIRNSKSFFGLLKIPFLLIAVTLAHKEQEKIYKEKIKTNPNLALPPLESYLDYQEALKEKECFTYKLGEAFIKAYKSWYKGGFIKFFFEAKSLYKEFKSKKAKQE